MKRDTELRPLLRKWEKVDDDLKHEVKKLARRQACQRIRCTALGPTADQEGWLHGLIDFVAKHDRMPDEQEQYLLHTTAISIRKSMDDLALLKPQPKVKGWQALGGSGALPSLRTMRKSMVDKAYREVFGEIQAPEPKPADPEQDAYAEAMAAAPAAEGQRAVSFEPPLPDSPAENNEPAASPRGFV